MAAVETKAAAGTELIVPLATTAPCEGGHRDSALGDVSGLAGIGGPDVGDELRLAEVGCEVFGQDTDRHTQLGCPVRLAVHGRTLSTTSDISRRRGAACGSEQ
jgi:hypothetical protein